MTKPISRKMAVDCLLYRFMMFWFEQAKMAFIECTICHEPLAAGQNIQFDHIHADIFDGPHEYQNLRPVHAECHKKKTARDIKDNAKIKRLTGQTKGRPKKKWASRPMQSRPFEKRKP